MLWKCASSTTTVMFEKNMQELKDFNKKAYEWLKQIPAKQRRAFWKVETARRWSFSYLSPYKGDSDDEPDSRSSLFQEGEDDADEIGLKFAWSLGNELNGQDSPLRRPDRDPEPPTSFYSKLEIGHKPQNPAYIAPNRLENKYRYDQRQSMEDTLSKFMSELAKRHKENSNLIKEIQAQTDAAIWNQGTSIKTLEIQIGQISKVLQERGFGSLPSSTETNPRDQVKSISTTIEADSNSIRRIGSNQYAVSTGHNSTLLYKSRQTKIPFPSRLDNHYSEEEGNYRPKFTEAYGASHINNAIPRKEKDPGSFTLPCFINDFCFDNALVDLGASISVMPLSTYLNLGLGELAHTRLTVELADRTVKYPKGIAENVLVGIGKFTFPIGFIILGMPEDVKVPLILGIPFLSTARAKIYVYKRKITLRVGEEKIIFKSVKPASSIIKRVYMLSLRERMELDLEARLMGETLVLNRSLDPFLEDYIELNDLMNQLSFRRNQGDNLMPTIEEGEVIRTRNEDLDTGINDYPSYCDDDKKIHIDFLEDMDAYRDNEMGDVIFGEPFLREVGIKTIR
ncbi:mitochondrial proton/calcium exchanger protein-like protein isoform X1, partial [Tanacetum coccineum]